MEFPVTLHELILIAYHHVYNRPYFTSMLGWTLMVLDGKFVVRLDVHDEEFLTHYKITNGSWKFRVTHKEELLQREAQGLNPIVEDIR